MVKVGFFGGSGFLGSVFDKYIFNYDKDIELTILSRNKKSEIKSNFLSVDALIEQNMNTLPPFDVVVHGIADSTNAPGLSEHEKIGKQLQCTLNIGAYCLRNKVRRLIFLSSGAVYANATPKNEEMENFNFNLSSKQSAYGLAKLTSEIYLKSFCSQHLIDLCILRCFTFGGTMVPKNSHYAFANFLEAAHFGHEILVQGNGTDIRSYLHHDDFAYILREVILRKETPTIMNVGSSEEVSIKQLANKFSVKHQNCKVKILNKTMPVNKHYVPDIKILNEFFPDFIPFKLDQIIDESVKCYE